MGGSMSKSHFWGYLVKVAHYNSQSIPSASPVHLFDKSPALHSTYRTPSPAQHHPFMRPECFLFIYFYFILFIYFLFICFSFKLQGIKIAIWIRTASKTILGQVKQISFGLPTLGCHSIKLMKNKTSCSFNCCP